MSPSHQPFIPFSLPRHPAALCSSSSSVLLHASSPRIHLLPDSICSRSRCSSLAPPVIFTLSSSVYATFPSLSSLAFEKNPSLHSSIPCYHHPTLSFCHLSLPYSRSPCIIPLFAKYISCYLLISPTAFCSHLNSQIRVNLSRSASPHILKPSTFEPLSKPPIPPSLSVSFFSHQSLYISVYYPTSLRLSSFPFNHLSSSGFTLFSVRFGLFRRISVCFAIYRSFSVRFGSHKTLSCLLTFASEHSGKVHGEISRSLSI